jgi:hypothetical protein
MYMAAHLYRYGLHVDVGSSMDFNKEENVEYLNKLYQLLELVLAVNGRRTNVARKKGIFRFVAYTFR